MQTNMAAIKKIKYGLSLNNTNASAPNALDALPSPVLALGGVSGKIKLSKPNPAEAPAAIKKVEDVFSSSYVPIKIPATIHPMVPKTLIQGNCLPGSLICENATLLERAIVGMYNKE